MTTTGFLRLPRLLCRVSGLHCERMWYATQSFKIDKQPYSTGILHVNEGLRARTWRSLGFPITLKYNQRPYSTGTLHVKEGLISRMWQTLGFTGKLKYSKTILRKSSLRVYLCCIELIDYDQFFKEFNLPDTFNSWFRITELHMWMTMLRLNMEGKDGQFVMNNALVYMWQDVENRSKKLGSANVSARKEGLYQLGEQFQYALYCYDEGILSDDRVLAGALWRMFFEMDCTNPTHLETLLTYVRKQVQYLDRQDSEVIMKKGLITYLPLHGETADAQRTKHIQNEVLERVW